MTGFWTPRRRATRLQLALDAVLVPVALAVASLALAPVRRFLDPHAPLTGPGDALGLVLGASALLIPVHLAALYALEQYPSAARLEPPRTSPALLAALAPGTALVAFGALLLGDATDTAALLLHAPILLGLMAGAHHALRFRSESRPLRGLVAIGSLTSLDGLSSALAGDAPNAFAIRTNLCVGEGGGRAEAAESLLRGNDFSVVALDSRGLELSENSVIRLLELRQTGVEILDLTSLESQLTNSVPDHAVDAQRVVQALLVRPGPSTSERFVKRLVDVAGASLGLLIAAPAMLLIALCVCLDSPGGAFFVQERLGRHRRPFACLKFRTMVQDAEHAGPRWSCDGDPRITRVGHVLRRFRLDELPQLVNVLRGEMSLVGPRPIRAHFANRLAKTTPFYDARFAATPGLTGWAQVHQGYAGSVEEEERKFRHDLYYLENSSLLLDLYILAKTVQTIAMRPGV